MKRTKLVERSRQGWSSDLISSLTRVIVMGGCLIASQPVHAATAVRVTNNPAASSSPAVAYGPAGRVSVVWSDTRDGNAEIYYAALDRWGSRLTPDMRVTTTPTTSSVSPKLGVDGQGFVYVCWREGGNVWIAKLDWQGNAVVAPKRVDVGSYVVFMNPDLSALPGGGCSVGFGARTGALDDVWVVNFDAGLNKICNTNGLYHNLTGTGGPPVSLRCSGNYSCMLTWWRESLFEGNALSSIATASNCAHGGPQDQCAGNSFPTMNSHGRGVVYERSNHVYLSSGSGCGIQLSENPGPSVAPSAAEWAAGTSIVVWDDRRSGNADLYFASYNNVTFAKSGIDTALVTGVSASITPAVTTDGLGAAFVVWQDNRDGNNEIYFARTPEPPGFGTIVGTVFDAVTGEPVPFAQVDIVYPDRPTLRFDHIFAGADGHYSLAGLAPTGPWALSASSAGFVSPQVSGLQVAPGQTITVDLRLSTGRVLSGTIRDLFNGLPIGRAQVRVDSAAGLVTKGMETGPDGRYRFDLRPGSYRLFASVPALGLAGPLFSLENPYYQPDSIMGVVIGATDESGPFSLRSNTVVLVHGILNTATDWGTLLDDLSAQPDTLRAVLEEAGWHTEALSYNWKRTIEEGGEVLHRWLAPAIFRSSRAVAHSMGGLVTRWCAERIADPVGERPFSQIITLGTLHHGTPLASNGIALVKAFAGWPSALIEIPGIDLLSDLAVEAAIRKWIPFAIDFMPSSIRLNRLNQGPGHDQDSDGEDFCTEGQPDPEHPAEKLLSYVRYVAFAGDTPQNLSLWTKFMNHCDSDGAVPVHSARLYNSGANVQSFVMSCFSSDPSCGVRHTPAEVQAPLPTVESSVVEFRNSSCVHTKVMEALNGTPLACLIPASPVPAIASSDSSLLALPHLEYVLAPGDSAIDTVHVPAGARFAMIANGRQDGVSLKLISPSGFVVDSASCAGVPGRLFQSDPASVIAQIELSSAEGGDWIVRVTSLADSSQVVSLQPFLSGDVTLRSRVTPDFTEPGGAVLITAALSRDGLAVIGATVQAAIGGSDGEETALPLQDDGTSGDSVSGDGIYAGIFTPITTESWAVRVRASGGSGADYGGREALSGFRSGPGVDIRVPFSGVTSPALWTYPGDVLPFSFRVRNDGSANADSVWVSVRDDSSGITLKDTLVTIPARDSVTLTAGFQASQTGAHWVRFNARSLLGPSVTDPTGNLASRGVEVVPFGSVPVLVSVPGKPPASPKGRLSTFVRPNPSRDRVEIVFELPTAAHDVRVLIVDAAGRRVAQLELGRLRAGWHQIPWRKVTTTATWTSGMLFYRVQADSFAGTGRIVTLR